MRCEGKDHEGNACAAEATMLARSMDERICDLGGVHWIATEDHVYCPQHFQPGIATHLDGQTTQHAAMSVDDA